MGPVDIGKVASGETKTITIDDKGVLLSDQTGYNVGDDFKLVIEIYDDDGQKVDEIVKTVSN